MTDKQIRGENGQPSSDEYSSAHALRVSGKAPTRVPKLAEQISGLNAEELARRLIGASLAIRGAGGIVIETEAYFQNDPASHSYIGPTPRNATMFGPAAHAYIYMCYGIHLCLNVTGQPGEAVLIRALAPQTGEELMLARRGNKMLCNGPGRLTQALGLSLGDDGAPFDGESFSLVLSTTIPKILVGPRIGISKAQNRPLRFGLDGARGLSRPFPKADM